MSGRFGVAVLAMLLLQACATTPGTGAATGKSAAGSCLWGSDSPVTNAVCAERRWGFEGYLMAVNEEALKGLPSFDGSSPCQDHVARIEEMLKPRSELHTSRLHSCPPGTSRCHLSIMVTDSRNQRQYVLDNGAVLNRNVATSGVATLSKFSTLTHGDYQVIPNAWEVAMPDEIEAAAAATASASEHLE